MPEREKKQHNKEKAVHKVTVAERAAVDRHFARRVKQSRDSRSPRMEVIRKLGLTIRTRKSVGRSSWRPSRRLIGTSYTALWADVDERGLNFMLSVMKGIEPRDQLETMLLAQMAAVHVASMTFARRLAHVENHSPARQCGTRFQ